MTDYLINAKSIFHSLVTTGFPIMDVDFVEYVVDGLGLEYQSFIISLHFHLSITFNELYDLFIREEHLEKKHLVCLLQLLL